MEPLIFETYLYYVAEDSHKLQQHYVALSYPWQTPHYSNYLQWACTVEKGDYRYVAPHVSWHPLSLLRGVCYVLISYYATRDNNRYYVTPEGAIKEDEEFAFLKESLIQEYRDYEKKSTQRIEEEHEREEASDDKAPLEQDECERERLLEDSEYWDYLGEHPEAQTEEIEFYYNANGDIRRWTAIDWAPKEIEKGCWRVKPCMKSERDECPPIWLEEQLAPDPIHALIHSLLIITRHLVQYGKEHGIGHYYGTREGAEKNEATEYPLCMDWLELTLRAPYLWGIALPGPHKKVS